MPKLRILVCILIGLHLGVLLSGIWAGPQNDGPVIGAIRDVYSNITGAGGGWGFFSPDVGNQVLVEFDTDRGQRVLLHELVTPEVALRVGNMYRLFVQAYPNEKLKRSIAASLTAQVFRRVPQARKVTMIIAVLKFPSLREWGHGERAKTKEVYRISFTREPSR